MPDVEKEVNKSDKSVQDTMNDFFDAKDNAQEPNSPETVQTVETKENVDNTVKTGESKESPEGLENGKVPDSIPYARFQEIVKKNKEAEDKLKDYEKSKSAYTQLLDDPVVFKRHLERQGYSKEEIAQVMRDKGMADTQQSPLKKSEVDDFVMSVCTKKGWDFTNLSGDQKSYIRDLIDMTGTVFEMKAEEIFSKRLKPLEEKFTSMERNEKISNEMETVKSIASKYKFDFDKDILPAIGTKLDEMDKIDPLKKMPFDVVSYTKDLILQLVEERGFQRERQEDRDNLKKNSKPLAPGISAQKTGSPLKGKTVKETAENYLNSIGFKE